MPDRKVFLNQLVDLGGIATKNNFYSTKSKDTKGCLTNVRKLFNEFEKEGLIKKLPTITKVRNLIQEEYYAITKMGADYAGRTSDYKWNGEAKSPFNVMHESMVRDVIMAILRNYPDYAIDVNYHASYSGLRPDASIRMFHKETMEQSIFFLEIERKSTVDRVYNEKLLRYEEIFKTLNFKHFRLNAPVKVLVVYANLDFNCFLRPQQFEARDVEKLEHQLKHLIKLSKDLPENRYRFLSFNNFHRLNEPIWLTPSGKSTKLL